MRSPSRGARQNDVALIARRTSYHRSFSSVIYGGRPLRCIRPGGRGLFGDAVLTKVAIDSSDSQASAAQTGIERRQWLCVTRPGGIDVCTANLSERTPIEVAGNDAQRAELTALLSRRAATRTVIFAGDLNRRSFCAPDASGPAPTGRPTGTPGSSRSTEQAHSARRRRRWCRPRTLTMTSCWSAHDSCTDRRFRSCEAC